MKKVIKQSIVVFTILFAVLLIVYLSNIQKNKESSESKVFKELMDVAGEINKVLPAMADKETRFDNTMALPGRKVVYNYTLINYLKEEIDTVMFINALKKELMNNIKTTPDMEPFRNLNVIMIYRYRDKENNHICNIVVEPQDYQK
jgi:hypothetical protein